MACVQPASVRSRGRSPDRAQREADHGPVLLRGIDAPTSHDLRDLVVQRPAIRQLNTREPIISLLPRWLRECAARSAYFKRVRLDPAFNRPCPAVSLGTALRPVNLVVLKGSFRASYS